jgi:hypothetical protein
MLKVTDSDGKIAYEESYNLVAKKALFTEKSSYIFIFLSDFNSFLPTPNLNYYL